MSKGSGNGGLVPPEREETLTLFPLSSHAFASGRVVNGGTVVLAHAGNVYGSRATYGVWKWGVYYAPPSPPTTPMPHDCQSQPVAWLVFGSLLLLSRAHA